MSYHNNKFIPDNPSPLNSTTYHQSRIRDSKPPSVSESKYVDDSANSSGANSPIHSSGTSVSSIDSSLESTFVKLPRPVFKNSSNVSASTSGMSETNGIDDYHNKIDDDIQSPDNSFMTQNLDLTNFPLFKKAPKSFYNKIISHLKLVTYHPQNFIIKKGDESKSMYWILKGTVSITSSDGESIYNELTPGEFFGEIGILFNRPRTANVIAKTRVLVGVLTSKDFNVVLRSFPLMERRIRDEAQERIAMLDKKNNQFNAPALQPKGPIPTNLTFSEDEDSASNSKSAPPTTGAPLKTILDEDSQIAHFVPAVSNVPRDKVDATISINQFIKNLPVFRNLPSNIIHRLCLGVEPLNYQPFQYIFFENDIGSDIYFIVNGQVEVVKFNNENGTDKSIARLGSGNYFGEMSFLSWLANKPNFKRSASIRSITNVELIVIRSNLVKDLCNEYPFLIDHMRFTSEFRNHENDDNEYRILNNQKYEDKLEMGNFEFKFDFKPFHSRSVSPITPVEDKEKEKEKKLLQSKVTSIPNKVSTPKPISIKPRRPNMTKRSISLNLTPTLNNTISNNQFQPVIQEMEYIPINKRLKLNGNNLRRKSSILSHNGPLSDSLLLKVFEYLDLRTLMKLRLINRRWRQLLYLSPTLFRTLDLTQYNTYIDDKTLIEIIKFVGSRPQYIDISNCFHITDEGFSYMVNEIGLSGKIKSIKMSSNWEISAMAIMDLSVPSVGKYLQEIDLSNCRKVRDNVIERLVGWKENQIDEEGNNLGLSLSSSLPYDDDSFDGFDGSDDVGCKMLTKINVGYCKHLTDKIMYHISENCNDRLQELDLTRCTTITDKGFEYWTYKFFPRLTKLNLKDCTFLTDKSIISIANSLVNLQHLNLNFCCSLTDISIEVLCIGCQNLKFLDLSFCGSAVSDSSLLTISMNLKCLTTLSVKGCIRVTRAGIDSLLSSNSPLNHLNVSQCKNSNVYPGNIPAQPFKINQDTKSAFVTAGNNNKIIEIVV